MLNKMKIGARLGLGFGLLLLLLCVVAGIGMYQTSKLNDNVVDLAEDWLPSIQTLSDLKSEINGIRRATLRHVLEAEKEGKDVQARSHDQLLNEKLPVTLAAYEKTISSPDEAKLYDRIKTGLAAFLEQDKKLIALSNDSAASFDEARHFSTGVSATTLFATLKAVDEDIELNSAGAKASRINAANTYRGVLWTSAISMVLAVLCGIALGIAMTRSITLPIRRAVELAGAVAEGDLTSRIDVQGKDEPAQLLRSLMRMNENLTRIVAQVRNSSDSIATGSAQIATGN